MELTKENREAMSMEFIPAIDLRGGRVVRLFRGDYNQQTTYNVDPLEIARQFKDAGCRWLHVVDLDGARDGRLINLELIELLIRKSGLEVEVGGGIRTEEVIEYLLAIGAKRLILGTRAISDGDWFRAMVHDTRFRNRLVLGLDARDGRVGTHGWTISGSENPTALEVVRNVAQWPLAAIIYTDIARDGTLIGPNVAATEVLVQHTGTIPVIHSGGVGSLADIKTLKRLPIEGVIVGKAIYERTLDVAEAVRELAA